MKAQTIALAGVVVLALLWIGCRDDGPSPELRTYATQMNAWFEDDPFVLVLKEGQPLYERLRRIDPPPVMRSAHSLLEAAYLSRVLSDATVDRLEERDWRIARSRGYDEIPQCVDPQDKARYGISISTNSDELGEACAQEYVAMQTYLEAEFNWAKRLSEVCDVFYWTAGEATAQECIEPSRD